VAEARRRVGMPAEGPARALYRGIPVPEDLAVTLRGEWKRFGR
jgi:hypothetical protein